MEDEDNGEKCEGLEGEGVESKNSLKSYRKRKDGCGAERYVRVQQGQEGLRLRLMFRLRSGSVGVVQNKKRCELCVDTQCVMCDSGKLEDVGHFGCFCGVEERM